MRHSATIAHFSISFIGGFNETLQNTTANEDFPRYLKELWSNFRENQMNEIVHICVLNPNPLVGGR